MPNLLKAYLRPCWQRLVLVVILVLAQSIDNLYLPSLNADIINNGVVTGNTHYILTSGGFMLLVTFLEATAAVIAVYRGSMTAMAFGHDVRGAFFRQVERFSQTEVNLFGAPTRVNRRLPR